ncbi:uncharacterized protein LOC134738597 [Pongo pygmaeus]|uniref:uncharacterized protein LOC134738597 n=1 Tax=Pongo pygmaeus TaxID=9600 RepID=UPI00300CADA6
MPRAGGDNVDNVGRAPVPGPHRQTVLFLTEIPVTLTHRDILAVRECFASQDWEDPGGTGETAQERPGGRARRPHLGLGFSPGTATTAQRGTQAGRGPALETPCILLSVLTTEVTQHLCTNGTLLSISTGFPGVDSALTDLRRPTRLLPGVLGRPSPCTATHYDLSMYFTIYSNYLDETHHPSPSQPCFSWACRLILATKLHLAPPGTTEASLPG